MSKIGYFVDIWIEYCKFVKKYDKPHNGHVFYPESIYDF